MLGALKAVEADALKRIASLISQPTASLPTNVRSTSEKSSYLKANCAFTLSASGNCASANNDVTSLEPLTSPVGLELTTSLTSGYVSLS